MDDEAIVDDGWWMGAGDVMSHYSAMGRSV